MDLNNPNEPVLVVTNKEGKLVIIMEREEAGQVDPVAFDDAMEAEINKLPYTKHLDDGQYNDGQLAGFELGANWAKNYLQQTKQQ